MNGLQQEATSPIELAAVFERVQRLETSNRTLKAVCAMLVGAALIVGVLGAGGDGTRSEASKTMGIIRARGLEIVDSDGTVGLRLEYTSSPSLELIHENGNRVLFVGMNPRGSGVFANFKQDGTRLVHISETPDGNAGALATYYKGRQEHVMLSTTSDDDTGAVVIFRSNGQQASLLSDKLHSH
jgi:hypothetical protein